MTRVLLSWNRMPQEASVSLNIWMWALSFGCHFCQSAFKVAIRIDNLSSVIIPCLIVFVFFDTHKTRFGVYSDGFLHIFEFSTSEDSTSLVFKEHHFWFAHLDFIRFFSSTFWDAWEASGLAQVALFVLKHTRSLSHRINVVISSSFYTKT